MLESGRVPSAQYLDVLNAIARRGSFETHAQVLGLAERPGEMQGAALRAAAFLPHPHRAQALRVAMAILSSSDADVSVRRDAALAIEAMLTQYARDGETPPDIPEDTVMGQLSSLAFGGDPELRAAVVESLSRLPSAAAARLAASVFPQLGEEDQQRIVPNLFARALPELADWYREVLTGQHIPWLVRVTALGYVSVHQASTFSDVLIPLLRASGSLRRVFSQAEGGTDSGIEEELPDPLDQAPSVLAGLQAEELAVAVILRGSVLQMRTPASIRAFFETEGLEIPDGLFTVDGALSQEAVLRRMEWVGTKDHERGLLLLLLRQNPEYGLDSRQPAYADRLVALAAQANIPEGAIAPLRVAARIGGPSTASVMLDLAFSRPGLAPGIFSVLHDIPGRETARLLQEAVVTAPDPETQQWAMLAMARQAQQWALSTRVVEELLRELAQSSRHSTVRREAERLLRGLGAGYTL